MRAIGMLLDAVNVEVLSIDVMLSEAASFINSKTENCLSIPGERLESLERPPSPTSSTKPLPETLWLSAAHSSGENLLGRQVILPHGLLTGTVNGKVNESYV